AWLCRQALAKRKHISKTSLLPAINLSNHTLTYFSLHDRRHQNVTAMHLMYTLDKDGKRIYTLKKITASGAITKSAHPARFSPDDKFSRYSHSLTLFLSLIMMSFISLRPTGNTGDILCQNIIPIVPSDIHFSV